jgi:hypothetical protein
LDSVPDAMKNILKRQLTSKNAKFTPELRAFALTLNFYSPRAYNNVRSTFNNLLPHPVTINKWYSSVNGDPGFTEEAFEAIKLRVANCNHSKTIVVNLVLDEMAIRQKVEYSGDKFHGYCYDLNFAVNRKGENVLEHSRTGSQTPTSGTGRVNSARGGENI